MAVPNGYAGQTAVNPWVPSQNWQSISSGWGAFPNEREAVKSPSSNQFFGEVQSYLPMLAGIGVLYGLERIAPTPARRR